MATAASRLQPRPQELFRALADRTRLRLLNLMRNKEVCVCYFVEVIGASQPKISRHLAYLRRTGIVTARRQGKWMHYRIIVRPDPFTASILHATLDWISRDPEMRRDRSHLVLASCAPQKSVRLQAAPLPASAPHPRRIERNG